MTHIVVVGASAFLGRKLALRLSPRAQTLTLVARRADHLLRVAEDAYAAERADVVALDLADPAATEQAALAVVLGPLHLPAFGDLGFELLEPQLTAFLPLRVPRRRAGELCHLGFHEGRQEDERQEKQEVGVPERHPLFFVIFPSFLQGF